MQLLAPSFATISSGASAAKVVTLTVTGSGVNNLNIANAVATATSAAPVTVNLAATTGNTTVDFGATYNQYATVSGSTTAGVVDTLGFVLGMESH